MNLAKMNLMKTRSGWKKMNKLVISVIVSLVFCGSVMAQGPFEHLERISKFNTQLDAHEAAIADLQASDAKTKEELKSLSERVVKLENVEVSPVSTPVSTPVASPVSVPVDSSVLPPVVETAPSSVVYSYPTYPSTVTYSTPTYSTPAYSTPTYPVYSYPQYSTPYYNQRTYATPIRSTVGNCINGTCPRR